jgi:hypothetical protein
MVRGKKAIGFFHPEHKAKLKEIFRLHGFTTQKAVVDALVASGHYKDHGIEEVAIRVAATLSGQYPVYPDFASELERICEHDTDLGFLHALPSERPEHKILGFITKEEATALRDSFEYCGFGAYGAVSAVARALIANGVYADKTEKQVRSTLAKVLSARLKIPPYLAEGLRALVEPYYESRLPESLEFLSLYARGDQLEVKKYEPVEKKRFVELWESGIDTDQIRREVGGCKGRVYRLQQKFGCTPRGTAHYGPELDEAILSGMTRAQVIKKFGCDPTTYKAHRRRLLGRGNVSEPYGPELDEAIQLGMGPAEAKRVFECSKKTYYSHKRKLKQQ